MASSKLRPSAPSPQPTPQPQPQRTLQRQAFLAAVASLQGVQSPDGMQIVTQALSQALTAAPISAQAKTKEREAQLEWNALRRAFEFRRALLQEALTTAQVALLLGLSPQAVRARGRKGQLLSVREGGQLRFPLWQFDPAGSSGLVEGLAFVLRALDEADPLPSLAKMSWLRKPNASLGGVTPLEALRDRRLSEVLSAAP